MDERTTSPLDLDNLKPHLPGQWDQALDFTGPEDDGRPLPVATGHLPETPMIHMMIVPATADDGKAGWQGIVSGWRVGFAVSTAVHTDGLELAFDLRAHLRPIVEALQDRLSDVRARYEWSDRDLEERKESRRHAPVSRWLMEIMRCDEVDEAAMMTAQLTAKPMYENPPAPDDLKVSKAAVYALAKRYDVEPWTRDGKGAA